LRHRDRHGSFFLFNTNQFLKHRRRQSRTSAADYKNCSRQLGDLRWHLWQFDHCFPSNMSYLSVTNTSAIQWPAAFRALGRFNWNLAAPCIGKRPDQMIVAAWIGDQDSDATFLKLVNRNFVSFIERESHSFC
jgi:hypothetical protein